MTNGSAGRIPSVRVMSVTTPTTICIFTLCLKQRAEASGLGPAAYAPIAKAFSNLPEEERERGYGSSSTLISMHSENSCNDYTLAR